MHIGFWWANRSVRGHLEDAGMGGRISVKCNFKNWDGGGMDWIDLAQDRDRWRTLVNAVINLRVP